MVSSIALAVSLSSTSLSSLVLSLSFFPSLARCLSLDFNLLPTTILDPRFLRLHPARSLQFTLHLSHLGPLSHLDLTHPVAVPVPGWELARSPRGSFLLFSLVGALDPQTVGVLILVRFGRIRSPSTYWLLPVEKPPKGVLDSPPPFHPSLILELPTALFPEPVLAHHPCGVLETEIVAWGFHQR
ncbi:hypothetical protein P170DRAFT_219527 [Aspergillus steynii IBT 23096]|uniref:Secreted protein n=1 Tax=Aspergillus steynii IBT 23096 TaxID=1392250 RepID=A0A2I2G1F1_9EURO|nr:uncharacterized protein P170DRAFT_219527 [Aspergillus steynii IBT 23096]PLB46705.1 hypothetical protein P170DRAFT_219527 [Aspergillus steynii IBT 23096]